MARTEPAMADAIARVVRAAGASLRQPSSPADADGASSPGTSGVAEDSTPPIVAGVRAGTGLPVRTGVVGAGLVAALTADA